MGASLVNCPDQEAHAEGSFGRMRGLDLGLSANFCDEALDGVLTLVGIPVAQALVPHKLGHETCVGRHARDDNAHVRVNLKDLLLVRG